MNGGICQEFQGLIILKLYPGNIKKNTLSLRNSFPAYILVRLIVLYLASKLTLKHAMNPI